MGPHLEDLDGHVGYGARRLPDGTLSTTWSVADRVDAHVAACSCGWRGGAHPGDEEGYEAAVGEWEADHARPLLAVTVPAEVADAVSAAEQAVAALAGERPGPPSGHSTTSAGGPSGCAAGSVPGRPSRSTPVPTGRRSRRDAGGRSAGSPRPP